jgi:hypothetical protein
MKALSVIVLTLLFVTLVGVAAAGELDVETMAFCTSVEDRTPVGESAAFDNDVGLVYCFTKIVGAEEPTKVFHVWYHGDVEMAKVELPVNSVAWRTWSTKQILAPWTGAWRVDVQTADGTVLRSAEFAVRTPEETPADQ